MRSDTLSTAPTSARQAFAMLMSAGCVLAAVTHVAFGYLFWRHGALAMAWVNVGSVLTYLLTSWLLRRQRLGLAVPLIMAEVIFHALAAVLVVGWDSGFHLYLMVLIPIYLANPLSSWPVRLTVSTALSIVYVTLDLHGHHHDGLHPLPTEVLSSLHAFNLATTILLMSTVTVLYVRLVSQAEQRLNELATTDSLTGLMNRRSMQAAMGRLQTLRQRKPQPATLILLDLDHFKQLNDEHGHALGDWALQAAADVLSIGVRDIDLVARWGGEEFLIALPDTTMDAAAIVAERLRQNIEALHLPKQGEPGQELDTRLSATFGLAPLAPDQPLEAAIHAADVALYQGKQQGRNRVVLAAG